MRESILKIIINKKTLVSKQIWSAGHREEDWNHDVHRTPGTEVDYKACAYCPPSGTQEENTELLVLGGHGVKGTLGCKGRWQFFMLHEHKQVFPVTPVNHFPC